MIGNFTAEDHAKTDATLDDWLNKSHDPTTVSNIRVGDLQAKMGCWPPANGLGLTLLKINENAALTVTDTGSKKACDDSAANKTKGVVTGFNFYSKTTREAVLAEYGNQLLNNELNKVCDDYDLVCMFIKVIFLMFYVLICHII
jgi:hypothetical protein